VGIGEECANQPGAFVEPSHLAAALRGRGLVNVQTTPLMFG